MPLNCDNIEERRCGPEVNENRPAAASFSLVRSVRQRVRFFVLMKFECITHNTSQEFRGYAPHAGWRSLSYMKPPVAHRKRAY